jgi:hypothetical protein
LFCHESLQIKKRLPSGKRSLVFLTAVFEESGNAAYQRAVLPGIEAGCMSVMMVMNGDIDNAHFHDAKIITPHS